MNRDRERPGVERHRLIEHDHNRIDHRPLHASEKLIVAVDDDARDFRQRTDRSGRNRILLPHRRDFAAGEKLHFPLSRE